MLFAAVNSVGLLSTMSGSDKVENLAWQANMSLPECNRYVLDIVSGFGIFILLKCQYLPEGPHYSAHLCQGQSRHKLLIVVDIQQMAPPYHIWFVCNICNRNPKMAVIWSF